MHITLMDLEGRPGLTQAEFVKSRTAAVKLVQAGKTVTSAGSDGAINVWRDLDGYLHATFNRRLSVVDHRRKLSIFELNSWLKRWFPEMGRIGA